MPLAAQQVSPTEADLRATVTKFYDSFVEGKYRKAYLLVAEESQEAFLALAKPKLLGFEIVKLTMADGGKSAAVTVQARMEMRFAGNVVPTRRDFESAWKFDETQGWLWHAIPETKIKTPFGTFSRSDGDATKDQPAKPLDLQAKLATAPRPEDIAGKVKVLVTTNKLRRLEPGKIELEIQNNLPGWIAFSVELPNVRGLSLEPMAGQVEPGKSQRLKVSWDGQEAPKVASANGLVRLSPVGGDVQFPIHWID